jgi:septal ring factor EnvC (AmiA/AmiB activator)
MPLATKALLIVDYLSCLPWDTKSTETKPARQFIPKEIFAIAVLECGHVTGVKEREAIGFCPSCLAGGVNRGVPMETASNHHDLDQIKQLEDSCNELNNRVLKLKNERDYLCKEIEHHKQMVNVLERRATHAEERAKAFKTALYMACYDG